MFLTNFLIYTHGRDFPALLLFDLDDRLFPLSEEGRILQLNRFGFFRHFIICYKVHASPTAQVGIDEIHIKIILVAFFVIGITFEVIHTAVGIGLANILVGPAAFQVLISIRKVM